MSKGASLIIDWLTLFRFRSFWTICCAAIAYLRDVAAGVPARDRRIDVGGDDRDGIVAVEVDLEGAELLRKSRSDEVSTCQKPLPGSAVARGVGGKALTTLRCRCPAIHIEEVRRVLELRDQLRQGDGVLLVRRPDPPRSPTIRSRTPMADDADRDVGGDDHELVGGLPGGELRLQPGPAVRVEVAVPVDVRRAVGLRLGVVEHDHLERHVRLRHEAVAGKALRLAPGRPGRSRDRPGWTWC